MKIAAFLATFCALTILIPTLSFSAPNQFGETGLVENPMASTALPFRINAIFGMKYFDIAGDGELKVAPLGFAFGIFNTYEMSMALNSYTDDDLIYPGIKQNLRIAAKWRFIQDIDGYPALAIGIWGDNLMGAPGFGSRLIAQKQIDGFQFMVAGGYLLRKEHSFAMFGAGFERKLWDGFDFVLDASYAMASDSEDDDRLRVYPALRYYPTPKIMLMASFGAGLDGNETVMDSLITISFLSHESRDIKRAKPDVPEAVQPAVPPTPEPEPYETPRPKFKLRIPEEQLEEDSTS